MNPQKANKLLHFVTKHGMPAAIVNKAVEFDTPDNNGGVTHHRVFSFYEASQAMGH